jgi:hypothetical protein
MIIKVFSHFFNTTHLQPSRSRTKMIIQVDMSVRVVPPLLQAQAIRRPLDFFLELCIWDLTYGAPSRTLLADSFLAGGLKRLGDLESLFRLHFKGY